MKKTSRFVALSIGLATCCGIALPAINYAVNIDTSTQATHGTRFHSLYLGNQETDPNATLMQANANNNLLYISNGIIAGKNNDGNGNLSSIGGGSNNEVSANNAGIAGGERNKVDGQNGIIGGGQNNTAGANATVIGGNWNTANENGNILGGANGNAGSNGTVLGGSGNSAGENGLALGQNSNGGLGSFTWNATEENNNSARVDTDNGVLIGTNTPISGVDLVVSGSIKLNEGQKIGTGLQGEVRVVDGCFYLYDGITWNLISQADTGNCKGWRDTAGTDISPAKTCEFGKIELKEGDKVWAYSATINPNCESIKAEVTCKDGSLKTALGDTKYIYSYCHDGTGEVTEIICEPQPTCGGNKCAQGEVSASLGDTSFTCQNVECNSSTSCNCPSGMKRNTDNNSCTIPLCLGELPTFSTGSNITPTEFKNWDYDPNLSSACTYKCNSSTCTSGYTLTGQNVTGASTYARCFNYTHSEGNCIPTQKYKVTSCQTGYELKEGKCELVVCPANTCTSEYTLSSPEAPNAKTYTPCSNFSTDGLCTETKKWKIESCNLGNCDSSYTLTGENDPHATSYAECTSYKLENDCSPQHKYKVKTCEEGYSLGKDGLCHKDCYLEGDGTHVKYNEKIDAYTAQNPECPTNCGATQERKCVGTGPENSYLNGNNQYKYSSCTPQPITCDSDYKYYSPIVSNAKEYATCTEYTVSNKTCNSTTKYKVTKCNDGYYLTNGECKPTSCKGTLPENAIPSTSTPDPSMYWNYDRLDKNSPCSFKCPKNECDYTFSGLTPNREGTNTYETCTYNAYDQVANRCVSRTRYKVTSCKDGYILYDGECISEDDTCGGRICPTGIYSLNECPDHGICDTCTEEEIDCTEGATYYKLSSCEDGYTLVDGSCVANPSCTANSCSTYSLSSCPTNGNCSSCTILDSLCNEGATKYTLTSCKSGYHKSGNSCVANSCASKPANSTWWNSNLPSTDGASAVYSASSTSTACRYYCNNGYSYSNGSCVANPSCTANSCSTYSLSSCPTNGNCSSCTILDSLCNEGATKYTLTSCKSGYHKSGNSCVANSCASKPANSTWWNSNLPSTDGASAVYSASSTSTACRYYCNNGYSYSNGSCVANPSCTANSCSTYSLSSCPTNGNCSSCTILDSLCNEGATKYTLTSCKSGYHQSGKLCIANSCASKPANSTWWNSNKPSTDGASAVYSASSTSTACRYYCNNGYKHVNGQCLPVAACYPNHDQECSIGIAQGDEYYDHYICYDSDTDTNSPTCSCAAGLYFDGEICDNPHSICGNTENSCNPGTYTDMIDSTDQYIRKCTKNDYTETCYLPKPPEPACTLTKVQNNNHVITGCPYSYLDCVQTFGRTQASRFQCEDGYYFDEDACACVYDEEILEPLDLCHYEDIYGDRSYTPCGTKKYCCPRNIGMGLVQRECGSLIESFCGEGGGNIEHADIDEEIVDENP